MTAQNGLLQISKWTPEAIHGKPTRILLMKLSTGVSYEVNGVIRAERRGEEMHVVVEGLDDSCKPKRVPMISQEMLDSAEERDGVLLFDFP